MCSDEGERYIGLLCVSLRPGQGLTYVLRSGRWAPWQDRFRGFSGVGGRLHGGVSGGRLLEAPDEVPLCPFEFLLPLRQRMEIVFPPYA